MSMLMIEEPEIEKEELVEEVENPSAFGRILMDVVETILLSAVLFLLINALSARVRVDGFSMNPTLQDGEFVFVNRLSYKFSEPARGDIIVFHFPIDPERQDLIKRIIGLPGDEVRVENGRVYINGHEILEPYIAAAPLYSGKWKVADNELFVLGDNRNDSSDSHSWGFLPYNEIVGKAIFIYWPSSEWKLIDHFDVQGVS
jgi:signal peptidase I